MAEQLVRVAKVRRMLVDGSARDIRLRSGLSLSEVARRLGVSSSLIYYYENAKRSPRVPMALKYLALLEQLEREVQR